MNILTLIMYIYFITLIAIIIVCSIYGLFSNNKNDSDDIDDFHKDNSPCKHGFRTDIGSCSHCHNDQRKKGLQ